MDIIKINNLTYSYKNKNIFNNLNLNIKENTFITIAGSCGCGKTTLVKILAGLIDDNFNIEINGLELNKKNIKEIRKSVGIVFENPDNSFIADTVEDEITFSLENIGFDKDEIKSIVKSISNELKIENLLELSPYSLSGGEKQIVALASALAINPRILMLDESLSMLDGIKKEEILKYLKKINKEKKITIINITQDLEESIYGKELLLINKGNIILNEKINKAFENEKTFKECNLELPFMALLSTKLKYYGLVDNVILDMDKMVNILWK